MVVKQLKSICIVFWERAFSIGFLLKRAFPKSALAVRLSAAAAWPVELRESVWGVRWRASSGIFGALSEPWSVFGAFWEPWIVFGAFSERFWSVFGALSERFAN